MSKPEKLPRPYEYAVPVAEFQTKYAKLLAHLKEIELTKKVQHAAAWKKPITRGVKMEVFLLSHSSWCTKEEWDKFCKETLDLINDLIGGTEHTMPTDAFTTTRKFSVNECIYIAFNEML